MRTLLVAAGVLTLDGSSNDGAARCLLVEGGRIVWIGAEPARAPPAERTVDLGGAFVTPGFVDAHVHLTATGLLIDGVDLDGVVSGAHALAQVRSHVAAVGGGGVVLGARWDDTGWPDAPPSAEQLSEAAGSRPVQLYRVDGHSCLVDERTLERLPLERLQGVRRDANGRPTGELVEAAAEAANQLVQSALPAAQLATARAAACAAAQRAGIVSLHEMGSPGLSSLQDALAWASGDWPVEVLVWWATPEVAATLAQGLRPGGDLYLDGSIGSRTAAVSGGYRDGPARGGDFLGDAELATFFADATAAGTGAGVHAIGDQAIERALVALERVAATAGAQAVRRCRHRIEHVELPVAGHGPRMAHLGVVASMQPVFDRLWGGRDQLYAWRFGPERSLGSNPFARLSTAGVPLAFGSDSTVTPLGPWAAVFAAEHHLGGLGLDRLAALRAHTLGGRYAAGQDSAALQVGGRADLAVWDEDPLVVDDVRSLRCLATMVAGTASSGW